MPPLLTLRHLRKSFGDRQLFDIDLLNIAAGTAYVLTGLNGAGKSTLLRVLGGLESAQAEAAAFQGEAVNFSPYPKAMRESVIYVHQHPVMFSTSVAANIAYGLVARGLPRQRIDALVDEAMAWAGVVHLRDSRTQTLSGGEKQRVALARAKVLQPRLLLLDEPTSNLDGAAREQVLALIPSLTASGASVIMACHDRDLISLRGVHRLKLSGGRIQVRAQRSRAA